MMRIDETSTEYKKSYKGFVLLMFGFILAMFLLPFLPGTDAKTATLLICNLINLWMTLLTWVIYKTEKIYWYTGITYETAAQTSSEGRKRYAWLHFRRFAAFAAVYILYTALSLFFHASVAADLTIDFIGIVAVAISTINIKLKDQ